MNRLHAIAICQSALHHYNIRGKAGKKKVFFFKLTQNEIGKQNKMKTNYKSIPRDSHC